MADFKQMANELRAEAEKLTNAADALEEISVAAPRVGEKRRTGARKMSKEARARIGAAQRKRWAEQKKQEKAGAKAKA